MQWNPALYNAKHAFVYDYGASLIELLAPQLHERILDLGCGTGELTYRIGQQCGEVIGMDHSAAMIRQARADFPGVPFKAGDAADFRYELAFDAIFSNATLHWVSDYRAAAACMYANLRPGGRLVAEFGGRGNVATIVTALQRHLAARGHATTSPWYFPSIGDYTPVLENAGFRVTYATHYDRPTPLADSTNGIVDWLTMFGALFFEGIEDSVVQTIVKAVQEELRPTLFVDGQWVADYKRIRLVAVREP